MSSVESVIADAMELSLEERRRVARELVLSIDSSEDEAEGVDAAAEWATEIAMRVREIENGEVEMIDGDEAHRRLRETIKARRRES